MSEGEGGIQSRAEILSTERDVLAERLEDCKSILLVTKLLCDLLRDKLSNITKGVRRKSPTGWSRDRILQLGGGSSAVDDKSN